MNEIILKPIGFVSSPVTERMDENWGEITCRVILKSKYFGAFSGLEAFSHAIVVTYLHQSKFDLSKHLQRRPRGIESMPKIGIFSQRAKNRPNPIGITTVEIVNVSEGEIEILGLDAINETPVLDVKPYYPQYDKIESPLIPEWVERLMKGYF